MQIKTMKYCYINLQMAKIQNADSQNIGNDVEQRNSGSFLVEIQNNTDKRPHIEQNYIDFGIIVAGSNFMIVIVLLHDLEQVVKWIQVYFFL
jgi:hypothetical protein